MFHGNPQGQYPNPRCKGHGDPRYTETGNPQRPHRTVTEAKGADSSFWFVLYTELRSKAKHFEIKSPGVLGNFNKSLKRMIQSLPLMET